MPKKSNKEISCEFYSLLEKIHKAKLSIGLQLVEGMHGLMFYHPYIQDENGNDVAKIMDDDNEGKIIVYLNRYKNADLAENEAYSFNVPEEEIVVIEENDDRDYAIETLLSTIEVNDILVIGGIEDLCEDNDYDSLLTLLNELDEMDVTIYSNIEGAHKAKYFYDIVRIAENLS